MPECVGQPVTPAAPGATKLQWFEPMPGSKPRLVLAFTCERCTNLSFELVDLGGRLAIRRTDWRTGQVREVGGELVSREEIRAWWEAILRGRAI